MRIPDTVAVDARREAQLNPGTPFPLGVAAPDDWVLVPIVPGEPIRPRGIEPVAVVTYLASLRGVAFASVGIVEAFQE